MNLLGQLEQLKTKITTAGAGREAFDTWNEIKSELTTRQRVDILTAWNLYLRTDDELSLVNTIESIKREIED